MSSFPTEEHLSKAGWTTNVFFEWGIIPLDEVEDTKNHVLLSMKLEEINCRYDKQSGWTPTYKGRSETPAQKRRTRKQKNKWRRRLLGEF